MKNILFFLCFIIISCDENQESEDINQPAENFYALTVGNSWVYKNYRYDSSSNSYEITDVVDSVSIVGKEDINGKSFYKFRRLTTGNDSNSQIFKPNGEHFEFLRDSSGTLIDDKSVVKYVNDNFTERLTRENDWGDIYEKLLSEKEIITLDSGEFDCYVMTRYAKRKEGERLASTDYIYYSEGFGLIYETISYIVQDTPVTERRLDSFVIN